MSGKVKSRDSKGENLRLDHFLADYGGVSRRKAKEIVKEGVITVNGDTVTEPGYRIITGRDSVERNFEPITLEKDFVYIALYKPRGYVTTTVRTLPTAKIVLDVLPSKIVERYRLFPVGRLDKDSEGLLLITNDGKITNLLTHPKFSVEKEYQVILDGKVEFSDIEQLKKGIYLKDGKSSVDKVKILYNSKRTSLIQLVIHEGRRHQIRRMFKRLDLNVKKLIRTRIGHFCLNELKPGEYRLLQKSVFERFFQNN